MARARGDNYRRALIARLPHAVKLYVPPQGFGSRLNAMHAWAARRCGLNGYATVRAVDRTDLMSPRDIAEWRFEDPTTAQNFEREFAEP
jgi:hypothetical protein